MGKRPGSEKVRGDWNGIGDVSIDSKDGEDGYDGGAIWEGFGERGSK